MPPGLHSSVETYEVQERALPPPRRRAELVKWAARAGAGAMGLLLVISAKDMALAKGGGGGVGATSQQLFAENAAQSDRIRSETIALLGGVHRRQSLLDAHGMHLKLDADMSALDKIIGKERSTRTSSLLKTSLSARIIAQASQVKKQAASLVGKSKSEQDSKDAGLGLAHTSRRAELTAAVDTVSSPSAAAAKAQPSPAAASPAVATAVQHHPVEEAKQKAKAAPPSPSTTEANPFSNDRKWSVAEEGKDMDSFFDSLNKGAAVKEAQARKEHMQHAMKKVEDERRKEEKIREAAARKSDSDNWPRVHGSHVVVKETKQPVVAAAPKPVAPKPEKMEAAKPSSLLSNPVDDAVGDARASAAAHDDAHDAVREEHKVHTNAHMSASALRKEESDFYSSLSTGKAQKHDDTKNVKISDSEERKSVDDFFDHEIQSAKASKRAADSKGENPELTAAQADKDLKDYWERQGEKAASDMRKVHEKVGGEAVVKTAKMTTAEAEADFNKFFDAKEAKEVAAIKAHVKDSNPKMSAEAARSDFETYFAKQQAKQRLEHKAAQPVGAEKAKKSKEEEKGVKHAMTEHDAMPGPAAAQDLSKYYDKLVDKAKTVQAKDDARIRARAQASGSK